MNDLWQMLDDRLKVLVTAGASFAAVGTFLIYLCGYLSLRFHLTAFGIESELAVFDERYLFAGSRFLIYLLTAAPIVVLLILLALGGWGLFCYLPYRSLPASVREKSSAFLLCHWERFSRWWLPPGRLALAGVALSVALIQLVMRQACVFSNLLVQDALSGPGWLRALLLDGRDGMRSLFFAGLLTGVAISGGLLLLALSQQNQTLWSRVLIPLLTLLVIIQFLLLPVNHGVLIANRTVPRVAVFDKGNVKLLADHTEVWQIWEGEKLLSFLVRDPQENGQRRLLITLPRDQVQRTEISRYDNILKTLFEPEPERTLRLN